MGDLLFLFYSVQDRVPILKCKLLGTEHCISNTGVLETFVSLFFANDKSISCLVKQDRHICLACDELF